ncbi:M23 family metallopeptidase [Woeseia oceani]|uniref:M23ase beta-sheet core domain-containing protein n=1 Tax=Woeseia oceani TaxID=1548547 RepID=A0A193LIP6_9GAMM|nr:M23 family metallopeptidase [Woeseia oceani]ANO52269.1 hypothetical protein BA177_14705 [Woeseia oceani]
MSIRLFACLLGMILPASQAMAACDSEWLVVSEQRTGDDLLLSVSNESNYPLTFTLRPRPRGIRVDGPSVVTETLAAGESRSVMRLLDYPASPSSRRAPYSCSWTVGDQHATHNDDALYQFPYAAGQSYRVLQGYGSRFSHTGREHYAVDFKMPEGTPVHAARDGIVARIEESNDIGCWEDGCGKYANFVVILHSDNTTGEYYHLQKDGALVEPGQSVRAGDLIALSGNTGHTTMPHLHFAVYRALAWGRTQSIEVRFASADGIVDRPQRNAKYAAIAADRQPAGSDSAIRR